MPHIEINAITVNERIRDVTPESVEGLAASIHKHGLLHPIIIHMVTHELEDPEFVLVAGERRLCACVSLGWEEIECKYKQDLTEDEALEIEMEENLQREDITWQEEVIARKRLHELKTALYGSTSQSRKEGWRLEDTADSLGLKKPQISRDIQLATALESNIGAAISKITTKEKALKVLRNLAEREIHKEIAKLEKQKREHLDVKAEGIVEKSPSNINCFNDDCRKVLPLMDDESVDMIICDPPYGIGDEQLISGSKGIQFDNDPEHGLSLYVNVIPHLYRVAKPSTHCYLFFAIQFYQTIRDLCEQAGEGEDEGFDVRVMPLIWVKESGGLTDMDWKFPPSYESILFMQKPPGKPLNRPTPRDTFIIPRESVQKRIHPMERPRRLIEEFIEISSNPGDLILDPFSGSFVVPYVSMIMDRRCVAVEENEDHYNAGMTRLGLATRKEEVEVDG